MIEVSVLLVGLVNYAYYIAFGLIIAWVLIGWFPTYPSNRVQDLAVALRRRG
jgi:hypothetical protein